ncbi:MAG TPA: hypothetical protein VIS07_07630 [Candidatus Binatia bacterium]
MSERLARAVTSTRAGALLAAAAVVVQTLWLAQRYPSAYLDADLLSYLAYWRDLVAGAPQPFGYTVPKPLPVLLFGPLGDPRLAFAVSVLIAAAGGAFAHLVVRRAFGVVAAWIATLLYVVDPMRGVLTLRSSADLIVGVALLGAVLALQRRAVVWAGVAILLAALGKPLAIACVLVLPLATFASPRRRVLAMLLPLLALPAASCLDAALAGRPVWMGLVRPTLPDEHELFVRVAQARVLGLGETVDLIVKQWFGGTLFAHTWPLVVLGLAAWALLVVRQRAEGRAATLALVAVPLLLALAYLGLAALHPMVMFTRFFWPLALCASLVAAGAVAWAAERLPVARPLRVAAMVALVAALLVDRMEDHRWRATLMLRPFETHAALAGQAVEAIAHDAACDGAALVPLAYLPLAAWHAPDKLKRGQLCAVEDWAEGRGCAAPTCVLFIPDAPTTERARQAVANLVREGFVVEVGDESGALVRTGNG